MEKRREKSDYVRKRRKKHQRNQIARRFSLFGRILEAFGAFFIPNNVVSFCQVQLLSFWMTVYKA